MRQSSTRLAAVALLALMLSTGGCVLRSSSEPATTTEVPTTSSTSSTSTTTVPATTTTTVPATVNVATYFMRAEKLTVLGRQVPAATPYSALQALLAGPTANERSLGITSVIPAGTRLLGAEVKGNEITLDMTHEFESGGGTFAVRMALAQVVYTVTQFPGITAVRFRIDGEPRDMLSGEGIMVDPATPEQYRDDVLPGILLQSPVPGDAYHEPIVIRGTSNVFEATVNYQLVAPNGTVLVEGVTMATCGTGCWGTFNQQLPALPAGTKGPVTLRVFDWSPADGTTMLDLVEFTLT